MRKKLFIFTINIPAKFKITWRLIFRGKRPARPTGAYFRGGGAYYSEFTVPLALGSPNANYETSQGHRDKNLFVLRSDRLEKNRYCHMPARRGLQRTALALGRNETRANDPLRANIRPVLLRQGEPGTPQYIILIDYYLFACRATISLT